MAPSARILLFIVFILVIHLTEPKDGYNGLAKGKRRFSSRSRRTYTSTYRSSGTTYYSRGGGSMPWWQIVLIVGGTIVLFLLMYCCYRALKGPREPRSDTPGIQTTRDHVQLTDHQPIQQPYPAAQYHQVSTSDGREVPPPVHMHQSPAYPPPLPHQQQQPLYPPAIATAPPPSYDDALVISKEPVGEGAPDRWEDEPEINRKEFGVI